MGIGLVIASVFSLYKYTNHDNADWNLDHNSLTPAYQYFDSNREAHSILVIRRLQGDTAPLKTLKCSSLENGSTNSDGKGVTDNKHWERVKSLTTWRGTNAGCYANGVVTSGACSGSTLNTGKNI